MQLNFAPPVPLGRITRQWWMVGLLAFACVFAATVEGQAPSSDQLEVFRNLTPEQQDAVLRQMGTQQAGQTAVPAAGEKSPPNRPSSRSSPRRETEPREEDAREPVLRAEDTVVVELVAPEPRTKEPKPQVSARELQDTKSSRAEVSAQQRRARLVESMDEDERKKLDDLVTLVLSRNPYTLDRNAQLTLPGIAPIALGGLTEEQATQRLTLEPVLLPLEVRLSRLPISKSGVASLKPFGYDLFDAKNSTFETGFDRDSPVPADYVIGPGDEFAVQLYGGQSRNVQLVVDREGVVRFPGLGPIRVGGMTFTAARRAIESRVSQQMIGVQASVSMGDTRAIRVFVLGEVKRPGSYAVSGLGTITTALFAAGGITRIGSLRDIQLKRQGAVVRRLDLYDFLIHGDTAADAKLLPGDAIFIPPVGSTISVDGEVKRPAIYELRNETSIDEVIRMAGGLTPEADVRRASLTQVDANARRVVLDVGLDRPGNGRIRPGNGDVLRIARLRPQIDAGVTLEGFVYRPGPVAWREGLRLTDVLGSVDELRASADQHYILVRREDPVDRRVSVVSADLTAALAAPDSPANLKLAPRDRITVFDLAPGRERIIQPLLDEIRLQSDMARPTEVVRIGGKAKVPGEYPLETGMRVSDLLRAGGNLDAAAFGGNAELTRYSLDASGTRQTHLINIDLAAVRRGESSANLTLEPFDYLIIKEAPDWTDQESVTLRGEVRFPGTYPIRKGETLREILDRAGGLTALAYPGGSAFTRKDLKEIEQQQLDRLSDRLRSDLAAMTLQAANAGKSDSSQALLAGQGLLQQLQGSKAVGRFVIDLPGLLAGSPGSAKDVVLRDGDELVVPRMRQEITVIGEVQSPTSHLFLPSLSRNDYIDASGGTTIKADRKHIYVVHADGNVEVSRSSLLSRKYTSAIKPGDTIVVPLDTERMPRLPFWQAVTQIIYNLAVSVAAINSF